MMISLLSLSFPAPNSHLRRSKPYLRRTIISNSGQNPPKTLFPGGYRRPEIKTPTLILRLTPDEVLGVERLAGDRVGGERVRGERMGGEREGGERLRGERMGGERLRDGGETMGGERLGEISGGGRIGGERLGEISGGERLGEILGGERLGDGGERLGEILGGGREGGERMGGVREGGERMGEINGGERMGEILGGERFGGERMGGERLRDGGERLGEILGGERMGGERFGEILGGEREGRERMGGEREGGERLGGERMGGEREGGGERGVMEEVDRAVSGRVGIVVVGGERKEEGGRLYEAARVLKEVIRDRAYLMVFDRVDIAEAVLANGVVLSHHGLPTIVARNTMMGSRSDSVLLPLIAKKVSNLESALIASNSEGADFLIYDVDREIQTNSPMNLIFEGVKVPIFVTISSLGVGTAEKLAKFGAGGFVISLKELKLFTDEVMNNLFPTLIEINMNGNIKSQSTHEFKSLNVGNSFIKKTATGFKHLEDKEKQLVEREKSLMGEVINVVQGAVPLMEEVSLLVDAVSQLDEPFMLVIVGEFNSGKSTVINALLGNKYLKDGVVPTTNEITFLRYSELESSEHHRCERHPDGQYICYLPSPILKEMIIVDTPGTNVILQRQQRLTEEFVPRADLLLFVMSADRPLTESEVAFLCYTQQWKKKVVFVLNKADLYQNSDELQEAITFIKENAQNFLNTENIKLYPVSARTALETKLSDSSHSQRVGEQWRTHSFDELEKFLYSFLDGTTSTGIERTRLKLETPIAIAEQLLSACQKIVSESCEQAKRDLISVNELVESVDDYKMKMESESIPWKRQTLSLIDSTQTRIFKVIESTLRVSNLDLVASYAFKEKSAPIPATSSVQYDIISPALSDAQKLIGEYLIWLQSSNAQKGTEYLESFEVKWSSIVKSPKTAPSVNNELLSRIHRHSTKVIENFSAAAASKLFEQEIREVFLSTFGGLGAAGLSASLLTSVLPTTLEDLLALGLCSAGGLFSVSNFPARRQKMVDKVKRAADLFARELEDSMEKDLLEATENLENFVKLVGKPYQDFAESRLGELLDTQRKLSDVEKKLEVLKIEIQNIHVSL